MAAAVQLPPPAPSILTKHIAHSSPSCPSCGTTIDIADVMEAQSRIQELEAQMERLKEKAATAVDKCADYEDQIRSMRLAHNSPTALPRSNTAPNLEPVRPSTSSEDPRPNTASSQKQSRFSFLTGRMGSPFNSATGPTSPPPVPPPKDRVSPPPQPDNTLRNELERERALRAKAEARVQKVDIEIEELSVQLFSQANEMVAEERRARAKLEERIEMLEKKDKDKMARLERLEKAVSRLDRVKAMLGEPVVAGGEEVRMLAPPGAKR